LIELMDILYRKIKNDNKKIRQSNKEALKMNQMNSVRLEI